MKSRVFGERSHSGKVTLESAYISKVANDYRSGKFDNLKFHIESRKIEFDKQKKENIRENTIEICIGRNIKILATDGNFDSNKESQCNFCGTLTNERIGIPIKFSEYQLRDGSFYSVFHTTGRFCSWSHARSYARRNTSFPRTFRNFHMYNSETLLLQLFSILYPDSELPVVIEDPLLLIQNGGSFYDGYREIGSYSRTINMLVNQNDVSDASETNLVSSVRTIFKNYSHDETKY